MKVVADHRLVEEAQRGGLRFACDDCAHFDESTARCAHGYPVAPHRPGPLAVGVVVTFCKEFDLGGPVSPPAAAPRSEP